MENNDHEHLKGILEALLFISDKPLVLASIQEVIEGIDNQTVQKLMDELRAEYSQRKSGLAINEIAGGYQMSTSAEYTGSVKKYYKSRHKEKLSSPALETLAIIAYKQPLTRLDIESIRGVNVDGVIASLLDKGLIRIAGRKDVIGRPFVYGTTRQFLEYFGLKSLQDLPKMEEFSSLEIPGEEAMTEDKTETQNENIVSSEVASESLKEVKNESVQPTQEG
ncbi:MAG: SMC-Scp complex subunit ScpB [Candidatus Omnitrophota bacterium]|nr:SMC-Scp complex subunit ScpB [Candidatus Omnitrophota bacterium]